MGGTMTAELCEKMRTTKKPLGRGRDIISQTSPLVKSFFTFFCIFLKVFRNFQPYIYTRARGRRKRWGRDHNFAALVWRIIFCFVNYQTHGQFSRRSSRHHTLSDKRAKLNSLSTRQFHICYIQHGKHSIDQNYNTIFGIFSLRSFLTMPYTKRSRRLLCGCYHFPLNWGSVNSKETSLFSFCRIDGSNQHSANRAALII